MPSLVTLAEFKTYSGRPSGSSPEDGALNLLIDGVEAAVLKMLGRQLAETTYTETRSGTGLDFLVLNEFPVKSITSIEVNGAALAASTGYGVAGWFNDDVQVFLRGLVFTRGRFNVKVVYVAGYADGELPGDIKHAIFETVGKAFADRGHLDVSSKALAGETITFITSELRKGASDILGRYRSRFRSS